MECSLYGKNPSEVAKVHHVAATRLLSILLFELSCDARRSITLRIGERQRTKETKETKGHAQLFK